MPRDSGQPDDAKTAPNLRHAIELTEIGLRLRSSALQENEPQGDVMVQVMRDSCCAKVQAWQKNHS